MSGTVAFEAVLVANRGEIAVRIIRTLRRMGIAAVAVFSDADSGAPHVRMADVAVRLGPASPAESYLHVDRVVAAACSTGATALHPGYGFLSEQVRLARACADAGVVFIGPPATAIETMADKARARQVMRAAGVPVVPGTDAGDLDDDALIAAAARIGAPLMVKPVAGGGGKGMAVVSDTADLRDAIRAARRQAAAAFGDDRVLLERFVERPRHIEVQVLADEHGTTLHLGERECSLQRRHQKIVEEAPSPLLDTDTRAAIAASAVAAAEACGYRGAGTVEFIVSADRPDAFWFLEMNTRLQVEHPVTEEVFGLDLVEWQVRVAAGAALRWAQDDLTPDGHAVEARVYAEDPDRGFLPTGGTVLAYREADGEGVRVDSGIVTGTQVPGVYDPLLAKVIAHAPDRPAALRRLDRALAETTVLGMQTTTGLLRRLLTLDEVQAGALDTGLVERHLDDLRAGPPPDDVLVAVAMGRLAARAATAGTSTFDAVGGWRIGEHAWTTLRVTGGERIATVRVRGTPDAAEVRIDGGDAVAARATLDGVDLEVGWGGRGCRYVFAETDSTAWIGRDGDAWMLREQEALAAARRSATPGGPVVAPMPGTVTAVNVTDGEAVTAGQTLLVLEAMKMEHRITAPTDGTVHGLSVRAGDQVEIDRDLLVVTPS
ncbi:MAG TPA: biotin carboxylase N-terminal domain-containing protein [Euzebyales bacterium]|nr:biotin carboxylase N-terminal domain-containing protein [Euzebyales bacterium]